MSKRTIKEKVVEEKHELDTKIDALSKFLSTNMPEGFDKQQWKLLKQQHSYMVLYSVTLEHRLKLL